MPWVKIAAFLRQSAMRHVPQDAVPMLHAEARSETCRHRRYSPARRHWKSLAPVTGGRWLTKLP